MSVRRGMNILDLLPLTTGLASAVPDGILEQIAVLNIVDHRSTSSPGFYLHEGTLQSIADQFDLNTANWAVSIPGVSSGLPFRVAITRAAPFPATPAPDFYQENIPVLWTIDIEVNPIVVAVPGLNAATLIDAGGVKTPTLQAVTGNAAQRRVTLQASCVLRISGGGAAGTQVQLMDAPDPLDPNLPSGATVRANMQPNTAVFGNSQFGMKLDTLVLDLSRQFTPADIEARGHDEVWTGMSLKELTFFLPINTPLVDNLTVGVRDLIIGSPFGMQGEVAADFSKDFPDFLNSFLTIEQFDGKGKTPITLPNGAPIQNNPPLFEYPVATDANAKLQRVRAVFDIGAALPGVADTKIIGVWWEIPGGTEGNSADTPWFDAPTDAVLRYRLRIVDATLIGQPAAQPSLQSAVPAGQTELQEVTASFPRKLGSLSGDAPVVDARIGPDFYYNSVHLRGPRHLLATVNFETRDQGIAVRWRIGGGSAPVIVRSATTFSLSALPAGNGPFELIVTDNNGDPADTRGIRRIRIDVVSAGPLAIGSQELKNAGSPGVVKLVGTAAGTYLQPSAVNDTFLAREYHTAGARLTAPVPATLNGPRVNTAIGTDAEVEVAIPNGANQPAPPVQPKPAYVSRAVQVLFDYGQATPVSLKDEEEVVTRAPTGQTLAKHQPIAYPLAINFAGRGGWPGINLEQQLAAWMAQLNLQAPGADRYFYVVGRTDDLWYGVNEADNHAENAKLAAQRMHSVVAALEKLVTAPGKIKSRIESDSANGWPTLQQGAPARMIEVGRLALPDGAPPNEPPYMQKGFNGAPVWRRQWERDATDNVQTGQHAVAKADLDRAGYRCAEIFAIDVNQAPQVPPPPSLGGKASLIRMLVPGQDGPLTKKVVATPKGANSDFRIRVKVRWDSAFATGAADYIPTLAEALIRWKPNDTQLPALGTNPQIPAPQVASTKPTGADYWEVLLNWAYDASTGQTEASGALSVPHGKLQLISDVWASGFAFAPALAAKVDESNVTRSEAGDFVGGMVCIAAAAAIGLFINQDAKAGDHKGSVIFDKFTLSYKWNGASHVSATTDYTVDLRINTGIPGVFSVIGNLKMAYKGVGVMFDWDKQGGLDDISLCMKDLSVQVVDPGTWTLGGPLGDLIRIASSRMGNGSDWMEFDLEFALDLGVIRLEGAVIRMRFASDPAKSAVELRGLTAVVEVPETIIGKGSATVGDGGAFRAMLALEVIPAKLSAYGSIAVDKDFVAVEVGIQLPVGIPLGATGFGLFGFMGRFVANGTRDMSSCIHDDPVERQLLWYALQPDLKYHRCPGQYAFGVGAVIGTLPDGGYSFNAEGALTIGFPDISVVFSIDAHLIAQRKSQATAKGGGNNSAMRILGMTVIEPDAIMIAVRTTYTIPKILELKIPISAYFPLAEANLAWYIRIGSDSGPGRAGAPISLTLFPTILDVKAWAFVMFEERQMHDLGGVFIPYWANVPSLDFEGFSIGVGAGFDLSWEAGPFSLSISAFLVLGLGTKPLLCAGAAGVAGSLDLVVVSLDVNGWLYFHIGEQADPYAEGHFCASVDCLLFTVEGCVDIEIGSKSGDEIPKPPSPISGMDMVDHLAIVKGKAAQNGAGTVPVVWPDTVGVLKFTHYVDDAADSPTGFVRKLAAPAALSPWSGSNQLKYAYRLSKIELLKLNGANWEHVDGPFDSAWWLPTHRKALIQAAPDGIPPSTEEGRELGLWSIDPAPWSRWLTGDSLNVPGNPAQTLGQLCDPLGEATAACAYGQDRVWAYDAFGAFKAMPHPNTKYPSKFLTVAKLNSNKTLNELVAIGSGAGSNYVPGLVSALAGPFDHDGLKLTSGWRFPSFRKQGLMIGTVPLTFTPSRVLLEGELFLQVCSESRTALPPVKRVCDTMPLRDAVVTSFSGASGAVYTGKLTCVGIGGERALSLSAPMLGVHGGAAVDEVSVLLDPGKDVMLLTAFDANDVVLARILTTSPGRQWLTLTVAGIVKIRVEPTKGLVPVTLFVVCWGTPGALDGAGRICDKMPQKDGHIGGFVGASGAQYEGTMSAVAINGERALVLDGRLYGSHKAAAVQEVSIELDPAAGRVSVVALNASGQVVALASTSTAGRQWLTLHAVGIVQVNVDPDQQARSAAAVFTVCWGAQTPAPPLTIHDLIDIDMLATPLVRATDELGQVTVLTGYPASAASDTRTPCRVLAYKLPRNINGKAWVKIDVAPWYKGNLSLVALCGITMEAFTAQQDDANFHKSLVKLLEGVSQAVEDDMPTQHTYLDAASSYKLKVSWQYLGWHANDPGEDPPLAASGVWSSEFVDEFRFDTAAYGQTDPNLLPSSQSTTLDMDPAQGGPGFDERIFDPRGVARFITHAYPSHEDAPHFLDDVLGFWFRANHLKSLVAKYDGRELQCKVYHTRPAAASMHGYTFHQIGSRHALDVTRDDPANANYVPNNPLWQLTTDAWSAVDVDIAKALDALPCIDLTPGSGGAKVTVLADLIPDSEYDLLLHVRKPGDSSIKEVVVARSHFRTSRYRNPSGLRHALGFSDVASGQTPNDFITTCDLKTYYGPLAKLALGDAAFDIAMKRCGMDPWPLPPAPRTTVIWRQTNDAAHPWLIAGVLLEADEPIWRPGMSTGALNQAPPPPRLEVQLLEVYRTVEYDHFVNGHWEIATLRERVGDGLREVVRNSAGTRMLFACDVNPTALDLNSRLFELVLQFKENGIVSVAGHAAIFNRPNIIAQEL